PLDYLRHHSRPPGDDSAAEQPRCRSSFRHRAPALATRAEGHPGVTETHGRVLVVDDDLALLQALSETLQLRMPALAVETTASSPAALDQLSATDYDAIVADIKMPDMDGIELLKRIREVRPDTPTLLITGHGEHDLAVQALRGGAHDYVQK